MRIFNQETKKKPEYCVIIVESFDEAEILHAAVNAYAEIHKKSKKIKAVNDTLDELAVY